MARWGAAVLALVLLIGAFAYWKVSDEQAKREKAELELGLAASKMINVSFQQKSDLVVETLSGDVVAKSDCQGTIFHPEQTTKAPVTVDYSVPLRKIGASAYSWSNSQRRLTITIPDVRIGSPNVDISRQVVRQRGSYISRECGLVLARKAAKALAARATSTAEKEENMERARSSAREAITRLANGVLNGAGMSNVRVAVLLAGETPKAVQGERWDETRPLLEVLGSQNS
ncbi:DUF4230 domain-containing protein [Sphingomonas aerophila]|uniref:DUF4230 domain-containing protein n=1 Tax=Sphingomonas aerophila TaxID=1344948 RepID=A0A7W9BEN7_9SPHN|nr:DUF4230 domain-containing protein [Sphingomonas aerophila]MBB5715860.1 hypothetical protein [Sphingomonas aerophila]